MIYCLNPNCQKPNNPDQVNYCQSCGAKLDSLLRGRYRVTQLIGQGGFGRTYLAIDEDKLKEPCIVKQFVPQVQGSRAQQKAVELFEQEAKRLQELGEHPQIPALFAYFEQNNYLYLVQQFIDGQNLLEELQQQGVFSEQRIRELLLDLLPIVQFIHDRQVIHRDIKPENIIRRKSDGKLVLIDFGVAKVLTKAIFSKPGTSIGSQGYAPCEQMYSGEAGSASDLFSLGVTCFHLLSATHPFELWQNYGNNWVSDWRKYLKNSISDELDKVLSKCLQQNKVNRYQLAEDILMNLKSNQSSLNSNYQKIPKITKTRLLGGAAGTGLIVICGLAVAIGYDKFSLYQSEVSLEASSTPSPTPSLATEAELSPTMDSSVSGVSSSSSSTSDRVNTQLDSLPASSSGSSLATESELPETSTTIDPSILGSSNLSSPPIDPGNSELVGKTPQELGKQKYLEYVNRAKAIVSAMPADTPIKFPLGVSRPIRYGNISSEDPLLKKNQLEAIGYVDSSGAAIPLVASDIQEMFEQLSDTLYQSDSSQTSKVGVIDLVVQNKQTKQIYLVPDVLVTAIFRDILNGVLNMEFTTHNYDLKDIKLAN